MVTRRGDFVQTGEATVAELGEVLLGLCNRMGEGDRLEIELGPFGDEWVVSLYFYVEDGEDDDYESDEHPSLIMALRGLFEKVERLPLVDGKASHGN